MAYGTVNADVIGTSVANSNLGAGNATNFKNRIINGDMRIDQRNVGASVTLGGGYTYTIDRFKAYASQISKYTVQQNAGSVIPATGFTNYLGATSSSAYSVASTDTFFLCQVIEGLNIADLGWGTANAKTITLSFWVYSSLVGTFGGSLRNSAENRAYPFSYTVSTANTWTQASVTIAGDTSGTWLTTNGQGIQVQWNLGSGSTFSGTSGSWQSGNLITPTGAVSVVGTNGATFYITGVQLEVGSSATGFEVRDWGRELILCQRYYEKGYPYATKPGTASSNPSNPPSYQFNAAFGIVLGGTVVFKTNKRSYGATINIWDNGGTSGYASTNLGSLVPTIDYVSDYGFRIYSSTSGTTILETSWSASSEL